MEFRTNAKVVEKFLDEAFNFGGEMLGKYMLNDIDTLADMEAEDIQMFQVLLLHAKRLKLLAINEAKQLDEQSQMISNLNDEIAKLKEQNDRILESLEKLSRKSDRTKND